MLLDKMLKFWPIIIALVSGIVMLAQTASSVAEIQEEATRSHSELSTKLERHEGRAGHEQTAIRLERIEVQQTGISKDVNRIQQQLDTLSIDVKTAIREK